MNCKRRFVTPGVNALLLPLLMACGDYSDTEPPGSTAASNTTSTTASSAGASTPTATTPASTTAATTTPDTTTAATTTPTAMPAGPVEPASCENVQPCGGDVVGTWTVLSSCLPVSGDTDMMGFGLGCIAAPTTGDLQVSGSLIINADGSISDETTTTGAQEIALPASCLDVSGTHTTCDRVSAPLQALGFKTVTCADNAEGGCTCPTTVDQLGGAAYVTLSPLKKASYSVADSAITITNRRLDVVYSYCVEGTTMTLSLAGASKTGPVAGTIVLQKQ